MVCRSGAKNSADTAATSSIVIASINASVSSSVRYCSPYSSVPAARYIFDDGLSSESVSCPFNCDFAAASSCAGRPSRATRASSSLIASTASYAFAGAVPT